MRKINGQPVDAITDISDTEGGEALKWDASTSKMVWELQDGTSYVPVTWNGGRGVNAGGYANLIGDLNSIEYITIDTTGNATDFGDLSQTKRVYTGMSNGSRGVFAAGNDTSSPQTEYITFSTTGNATVFGSQTVRNHTSSGFGNGLRGLWAGSSTAGQLDTIEYITIATTGNSTDFGNLLGYARSQAGVSNATRGVLFPGYIDSAHSGYGSVTTYYDVIEYVTIATTGNATDFGDSTKDWSSEAGGAVSNATRGVRGGGHDGPGHTNSMEYITVDTTGNATDFGDLTVARSSCTGVSNGTRGVFCAGSSAALTYLDPTMDYITIASKGYATDFGDCVQGSLAKGGAAGD